MQCTCVRQTDLPNTSKLFTDLVYHFDRVSDLYTWEPNNLSVLAEASRFDYPDERRARLVAALEPLNAGCASLAKLAEPGTVAVVTGQQVGLFSGPSYTIYKALSAIKTAAQLSAQGVPAVPVFWLATEDHDLAEVDHAWTFGPERLNVTPAAAPGGRPVGGVAIADYPLEELRASIAGQPFAAEAMQLVERAYTPGATLGQAFGRFVRELFAPWGLLVIDPMEPAIRAIAAPLLAEAVARMPELCQALIERSAELERRGYHAQVLVDEKTSLVFLLRDGERIALHRNSPDFAAHTSDPLNLSPNALLRPVVQDYLLPTAGYAGGAAELAYLAQSQVLYRKLLNRQPVAFPRAGFTLVDERSARYMKKYGLSALDLYTREEHLEERIAAQLVPAELRARMEKTRAAVTMALDELSASLHAFDITLAAALETSRRKIDYQTAKIARKTAARLLRNDEQTKAHASALHHLVFPRNHLQERLYCIVPFLAKYGPGLIAELHEHVQFECPDHQFAVV